MASKQLVEYIGEYLGKGYPRESITNSLLDQGFDLNRINDAFEKAYPTSLLHPFRKTQIDHSAMPKKKIELVLLGIFLIALLTGGITFFSGGKEPILVPTTTTVRAAGTTTALTPTTTAPPATTTAGMNDIRDSLRPNTQDLTANFKPGDMRITSIRLCNSVSDSFECDENTAGEFRLGQPVYIYFKLVLKASMKSGSYVIGFTEDRVVYDELGVQVNALSSEELMNIQREVTGEGLYTLPAYNLIDTSVEDIAGEYRAELTLRDKFSGEEITKTINYILV